MVTLNSLDGWPWCASIVTPAFGTQPGRKFMIDRLCDEVTHFDTMNDIPR
jgi:hypothetical protein